MVLLKVQIKIILLISAYTSIQSHSYLFCLQKNMHILKNKKYTCIKQNIVQTFFKGVLIVNDLDIYQDIAKRTDGDIYIGVVGPVRTGKSTFIKNFMDLLVLPNIDNEFRKERAKDELPQSAAGRTIMTTEPKFIPNEAVEITVGDNIKLKARMVDCVRISCK